MTNELPTVPVPLTLVELGWLTMAVWDRAKEGQDFVARALYLKIKVAAIALGVDWYYGDPWDIAASPPPSLARESEQAQALAAKFLAEQERRAKAEAVCERDALRSRLASAAKGR